MSRTRIMISGVRTVEEALAAVHAGADAVGFNFIRGSSRFVEPAEAWRIIGQLPPLVSSVGIVANASLETFSDIEEVCPTTHSQLQGSEDETLVRECGPGVIKAIRHDGNAGALQREVERWGRIDEVDAIQVVLPAPAAEPGFDFGALAPLLSSVPKPVLLGGLSAATVAAAVRQLRPFAVDLATATSGGRDPSVEAFLSAVRQADGSQAP